MEQDEDADADLGRRARGDLGVRVDGAGAGTEGDGEVVGWVRRSRNPPASSPGRKISVGYASLTHPTKRCAMTGSRKRCDVRSLARLRHCPPYPRHAAAGTADEFT